MRQEIVSALRNHRGIATSLLEATAAIAVGATLAGAAVTVVSEKVQDARVAQALQDVQSLADAINSFEKDNTFYPIFITAGTANAATAPGSARGPVARILRSESGHLPSVNRATAPDAASAFKDTGADAVLNWNGGVNDSNADSFEDQLNHNGPGYLARGTVSFSKDRGFAGPYLSLLPPTDPWGNHYECNVRYLDDRTLTDPATGQVQRFQTIVISAGPNEEIQTPFEAQPDGSRQILVRGDDIAYRVR